VTLLKKKISHEHYCGAYSHIPLTTIYLFMKQEAGCLICGSDLVYGENAEEMACSICNKNSLSNTKCSLGHFICDKCHSLSPVNTIMELCLNSSERDPIRLANDIMANSMIHMHGPEHHFLVPAVLLTCHDNVVDDTSELSDRLAIARERSSKILGGFCGFHGNCGAAVGTGIFISIITGANPLSIGSWRLANLMTSMSLRNIAEHGGPRCCKRNTFLAISEAIDFLVKEFQITLPKSDIKCGFSRFNKECKLDECIFFEPECHEIVEKNKTHL